MRRRKFCKYKVQRLDMWQRERQINSKGGGGGGEEGKVMGSHG